MVKWRVRFIPWPPFTEVKTSGGNITYIEGVVAEIYEGIQKFVTFDYEIKEHTDKIFGNKQPDDSWNGMIRSMIDNETDISGPYFVNEERSTVIHYGVPLDFRQLSITSGLQPTERKAFVLLGIFSWQVWLALITTSIAVASTASIIYHILPSGNKRGEIETFSRYIWMFLTALIGKGFSGNKSWPLRHVGSSTSFRILQGLWCTAGCVVLMYSYQGSITSTFTIEKLKPKIETMDDLLRNTTIEVGTFAGSYSEKCLSKLKSTKYDSIWQRAKKNLPYYSPGATVPPWLEEVEAGKRVFITDSLVMKNLIGDRYLKTRKCKIRVTPISYCSSYISIAVRKGLSRDPFLKNINKVLRRFYEADLSHRRFANTTLYYDICSRDTGQRIDPLKFDDVLGAFIVFATGIGISTITFAIEMKVGHRNKYKK